MSSLNLLIYLVGSWGYLRVSTLIEMKKGMKGLNNEQQYTNQSLNPILRFIFYNAVV
jgi:hypothetical protein